MHRELALILACPSCAGDLSLAARESRGDIVVEGELGCASCSATYPIRRGIPRFVPASGYADSFGFQWNRFKTEQFDTANGTTLSHDRFFRETGWLQDWMRGKRILDAGCGAGRFLDVATGTGAQVVGVDLSNAVDAAASTLADREGLDLVQARIDALPFRAGTFDAAYCIGVIQHTSDPEACVRSLANALRPGGRIAITAYELRRWTRFFSKYWARRLTRGLSDRTLYRLITAVMPVLFPITEVLFRIPVLGRVFRFIIPIANYTDAPLSLRQRYRWALLDTFDMLSPTYDRPQRAGDISRWLKAEGFDDIRRLQSPGLNLVGQKASR